MNRLTSNCRATISRRDCRWPAKGVTSELMTASHSRLAAAGKWLRAAPHSIVCLAGLGYVDGQRRSAGRNREDARQKTRGSKALPGGIASGAAAARLGSRGAALCPSKRVAVSAGRGGRDQIRVDGSAAGGQNPRPAAAWWQLQRRITADASEARRVAGAATNTRVLTPDCRRDPNTPFPAAVKDALLASFWPMAGCSSRDMPKTRSSSGAILPTVDWRFRCFWRCAKRGHGCRARQSCCRRGRT